MGDSAREAPHCAPEPRTVGSLRLWRFERKGRGAQQAAVSRAQGAGGQELALGGRRGPLLSARSGPGLMARTRRGHLGLPQGPGP